MGPCLGAWRGYGHPTDTLPPQASHLICPKVASQGNFPLGSGVQEGEDFSNGSTPKPKGLCCPLPRALGLFGPVGVASEHKGLWGEANEAV